MSGKTEGDRERESGLVVTSSGINDSQCLSSEGQEGACCRPQCLTL